jgi:dipeptidyl-peptidase 4
MLRHSRVTSLALGVAVLAITAHAQIDRARALDEQIGRIFESNDYSAPRFGPARWLPDGTAYTIVERSAPAQTETSASKAVRGSDIARYDATTGARTVLLASAALIPPGKQEPLAIDDYSWSPDGRHILIFTNTRRVWRSNTRGDYWILDLNAGRLRQLGGGTPESSLMFAKFSPDSSKVAYVRANNIYVESVADGKITQVTADGSETTINGTSDWVYEEELGVRDCVRWSPDSTRVAYWQFDTTGVGTFSLINNTDTLYPVITRIPYPKAGTANSRVRIGVADVKNRRTRWIDRDARRFARRLPRAAGVG